MNVSRRTALVGGAALAALAAVAIAIPALEATGSKDDRAAALEAPVAGTSEGAGPSPARLSAEEDAAARRIVGASPLLQRILGGSERRIRAVVPWATADERTFGAIVFVSLPQPVRIDATVPIATYDRGERASPPYTVRPTPLVATNVRELVVNVDLERAAVVSVSPGEGATVEGGPPPGQVPTTEGD